VIENQFVWGRGARWVGCVLAVMLLAAVLPAQALGETGREFVSNWSQAPVGTALGEPGAVAVDHATGEVFVADRTRGLVDVLSSSGIYQTSFGEGVLEARALAVDEATGDVYAAESFSDAVVVYAPDALGGYVLLSQWSGVNAPGKRFGDVTGIAFDNSTSASDPAAGNVYVVEGETPGSEHGAVDVFKPRPAGPEEAQEGALVRSLTSGKLEEPNGVAVSAATGMVYVADSVRGVVDMYSSSGAFEGTLTGSGSPLGSFRGHEEAEGNVTAIAVDETTGDLLVAEDERGVVSELSAAGEWLGWITGTPSGPFGEELSGLGVASSGGLYVTDPSAHVVDVFGPSEVVPDVSAKPPSDVTATSATLRGVVNGEGKPVSYHFELGEGEAYGGLTTTVVQTAGAGEEQVQAPVTGLRPDTRYYFRLVAEDEDGESCSLGRYFTTAEGGQPSGLALSLACQRAGAAIDSESSGEVGSGEATLLAQVDPDGHDTGVQFQYGRRNCVASPQSCTTVPAAPVDVGAGEADVPVSVRVGGLEPDTTYYYRVLASNSQGVSDGVERTLTTQSLDGGFVLPDGRAWEMVSPPDKRGAEIESQGLFGGLALASAEGGELTYVTDGAISAEAEGNRSPEMQQELATRTSEGWRTQDIVTPQEGALGLVHAGNPPEYQFFSADLSQALVQPVGGSELAEPPLPPFYPRQATMYVRDDATGTFLPVVSEADTAPGTRFGGRVHFVSATPNLSHVLLRSTVALEGETWPAGDNSELYEWSQGTLQLLSVLPSGVPAQKPELGFSLAAAGAVSADGSRVIYTSQEENSGVGHLYMRDTSTGQTLQLDAAQGLGEPEGSGGARFQTATGEGSRVFFTDYRKLTPQATPEPGSEQPDLYECQVQEEADGALKCQLEDLTVDQQAGGHADVRGFLFGANEEGSTVYLVAHGVLARNRNARGEHAEEGLENLYELHEQTGGAWQSTFIATLSEEDEIGWGATGLFNASFLTARVSPDGRYLAFMSQASLTGYDNEDVSSQKPRERMDEEVYLYDSQTGSLRCLSCDPTGARPQGVLDEVESGEGIGLLVDRREVWGQEGHEHWLAGSIPGWTGQGESDGNMAPFQPRYLSNEGRVFFDDADALLPAVKDRIRQETINGTPEQVGVENVYEYEPSGVGSCESPSGGCVALISSGTSQQESAFLEATPNGDEAFFLTAAALSPQDTDAALDIYDARVCSAESPCLSPPPSAPEGCASTETCRPASPIVLAPAQASGTATFSGAGNPKQAPAPGGRREVKAQGPTARTLTRAQRLAKALQACRARYPRSKRKRHSCEARARKQYAPKPKPKTRAKTKARRRNSR
jgi:DNA-binding beta-propeller fold protein YncE